jgi:hypothetical protein
MCDTAARARLCRRTGRTTSSGIRVRWLGVIQVVQIASAQACDPARTVPPQTSGPYPPPRVTRASHSGVAARACTCWSRCCTGRPRATRPFRSTTTPTSSRSQGSPCPASGQTMTSATYAPSKTCGSGLFPTSVRMPPEHQLECRETDLVLVVASAAESRDFLTPSSSSRPTPTAISASATLNTGYVNTRGSIWMKSTTKP